MPEEKEILCNALDSLNEALNYFNELEDTVGTEAHADTYHSDIYWEIKDVSDNLSKRIGEVE